MLDFLQTLMGRDFTVLEIIILWSFVYFAGRALGAAYTHLLYSQ